MSGCNRGPLRPDGKRPDWHKRDYPYLPDEAWNRPMMPDEFMAHHEREMEQLRSNRNTAIVVGVILFIILTAMGY